MAAEARRHSSTLPNKHKPQNSGQETQGGYYEETFPRMRGRSIDGVDGDSVGARQGEARNRPARQLGYVGIRDRPAAGIFKKHGLELEIIYTNGAGETQQAVISGSVDLGIAAGVMGVLGAYSKGAPVRVIGAETTGANDLYWYVKADFANQVAKRHRWQDACLFDQRVLDARHRHGLHEAISA